jgi:hypothetical protein
MVIHSSRNTFLNMGIFHILFPEIWAKIHLELVTPLDARDRVSLQRTCKAAHALDPGLILAPIWRDAWNKAGEEEGMVFRADARVHVMTRAKKRRRTQRTERRYAVLLTFLAQLDQQRVFDWCPQEPRVIYCIYSMDKGPEWDGFALDWTLVQGREELMGYRESRDLMSPAVIGSLSYKPDLDEIPAWELDVSLCEDGGDRVQQFDDDSAASLKELLEKRPRLFFHADLCLGFESDEDDMWE